MAGNVRELTRSLWGGYPYPMDETRLAQREDLQADQYKARVNRGGSFFDASYYVRCAYRAMINPFVQLYTFGFRVVMHPRCF